MARLVTADRSLDLTGKIDVIIGRHRDCDLSVEDNAASRRHCRLVCKADEWFIDDLDSANGTKLNGRPVLGRTALRHEDSIGIGEARIQVRLREDAAVVSAPVVADAAAAAAAAAAPTLVSQRSGNLARWWKLAGVVVIGVGVWYALRHRDTLMPAPAAPVAAPLVVPVATPSAPLTGEPDVSAWDSLQRSVEAALLDGDFGAAEALVLATVNPGASKDAVRALRQRVARAAETAYQQAVAALPAADTPKGCAAAMVALEHLRDTMPDTWRTDAITRIATLDEQLRQHVLGAWREGRRLLEAGQVTALPALAERTNTAFGGTRVRDLPAFIAVCTEAAALAGSWQGSWSATRDSLAAAQGADVLALAAGMRLAGEDNASRDRLLHDPFLADANLLPRREALLGRAVVVLHFRDPADVAAIETAIGQPQLIDGALTGSAGEPVSFSLASPFGGAAWDIRLVAELKDQPAATFGLTAMAAGRLVLVVTCDVDGLLLRVRTADGGWAEQRGARPTTTPLQLNLRTIEGTMTAEVNGKICFTVTSVAVPAGARLTIDVTAARWNLSELTVAGEP